MCAQVAARAELDVDLHACAPALLEREEAAILLQQKLTKAIRPRTPCRARARARVHACRLDQRAGLGCVLDGTLAAAWLSDSGTEIRGSTFARKRACVCVCECVWGGVCVRLCVGCSTVEVCLKRRTKVLKGKRVLRVLCALRHETATRD
jgi:hypothetical protein